MVRGRTPPLAGYVSPFLVGRIRDVTGAMTLAWLVLGGSCVFSSLLIIVVTSQKARAGRGVEAASAIGLG
ncbi:MAG TPA: hypothetical protein VN519_16480 [Bryobacteraceae bacterium]|nr:hypothetical protein [Bryobacteraceae bacterium]